MVRAADGLGVPKLTSGTAGSQSRGNCHQAPEGLAPSGLESGVLGLMGIMISLFGAFLGERLQARTRGHAPRRR